MRLIPFTRTRDAATVYVNPDHVVAVGKRDHGAAIYTTAGGDTPHTISVDESVEIVVSELTAP